MKSVVWPGVILSLALVAAVAVAQPEQGKEYQLKTIIKFNEVTIEGDIQKPAMPLINVRPPPVFGNRMELKTSFYPELLKSVEML